MGTELLSVEHHRIHERLAKQNKKLETKVKQLEEKIAHLKSLELRIPAIENLASAIHSFLIEKYPEDLNYYWSVVAWDEARTAQRREQGELRTAEILLRQHKYTVFPPAAEKPVEEKQIDEIHFPDGTRAGMN